MRFSLWTLLVFTVILTIFMCGRAPQQKKPVQVILLTVDTLRADRLGCYGYERKTSPNIDKLASDSALFTNASCNVPSTVPSFQSTLTGLAASEATTEKRRLNPERITLQKMMKAAGLTTAAVVANPRVRRNSGLATSFDKYLEVFDRGDERSQTKRPPGPRGLKIEAKETNDALFPILEELKDKSFFLWILYLDPHQPYIRHPGSYYDAPWPQSLSADIGEAIGGAYIPDGKADSVWFGDSEFARDSAVPLANYLYDGEVRFVDEYVGKLIDALKKMKMYDDALIVFAADHGESLLEHGYYGHGDMPYQPDVHVPMAIHWPGKSPAVSDAPVSLMDIMPTVCEWVGIPVKTPLAGSVLTPDGRKTSPPILISTLEQPSGAHHALRKGPYKLIRWADQDSPRYTLFNVLADPGEEVDLSKTESALFEKMKSELNEALGKVSRPAPDSKPLDLSPQLKKQLKALGYTE